MVHLLIQSALTQSTGYPGLWVVCAGSGIFVPLPEDVPLMIAGNRIAAGDWSWPVTLLVAWLGVGIRDLSSWAIGRFLVARLLESGRMKWLVGSKKLARAQRLVGRHGTAAVLIGRFMVGFRAPVFVAAGAMGVPLRGFALFDGIGLMIAIPVTVALGYWFGTPIAEVAAGLLHRATGIAAIAVVIGLGWLAYRAVTAPPQASPAEDDLP
ncbi:MAG: DedA family protein [Myxococcota bacterium]